MFHPCKRGSRMASEVVRQTSIHLAQWSGMEVPTLITPEGLFTPVKFLSFAFFGDTDDRGHRARIHRDAVLEACARRYPVKTAGGQQEMLCLERIAIGRFLNSISPDAYRSELRERMLQLQWEFTLGMDRTFRGEVDSAPGATILPFRGRRAQNPVHATLKEEDAQRFLQQLADRVGHIQIDLTDMQRMILAIAQNAFDIATPGRCPRCGYDFSEGA